jgi:hypothetical protein
MGVSSDDTEVLARQDLVIATGATSTQETIMKNPMKFAATALAAAAIGGAVALAPIAAADTTAHTTTTASGASPLVPYGTNPDVPYRLGYIDSNHDEANTTSNNVDLPF